MRFSCQLDFAIVSKSASLKSAQIADTTGMLMIQPSSARPWPSHAYLSATYRRTKHATLSRVTSKSRLPASPSLFPMNLVSCFFQFFHRHQVCLIIVPHTYHHLRWPCSLFLPGLVAINPPLGLLRHHSLKVTHKFRNFIVCESLKVTLRSCQ